MKKLILIFCFNFIVWQSQAQSTPPLPVGNIGIGTTSPAHELVVQGTSSPNIELKNSNYSNGGYILNRTNYGHQWKWWAESNVMYFGFSTNESSYANKFTIQSDGDIGIGTASPNSKLHVAGNGAIIKLQNTAHEDTANAFYGWLGGYDKSGDEVWWIGDGSSNNKSIGLNVSRDGYNLSIFNKGKGLTINQNGNIGIGTTTPDAKLAVNGNIHTKEVKVDLIGWSDFVFEDSYKLPTLKEVEQHIKEKGHLQDIPSAEEVKKDGIYLGEMDSKLLQKIEELMLYTIEQEKRIESLEDKNEKLILLVEKLLKAKIEE
ncbi:tail fiber protein [Jejuia spongiicola]|uniref:Tail fiber protein n=1 Tax=Jejuia spongiicola TaxID=2942207 RepID=A0ABT0QF57_9FLAO|nr:tail fiber protein [Jejuia spongiicola]MCL6294859.1 tail fiber protein [Jejuia spongiicola]